MRNLIILLAMFFFTTVNAQAKEIVLDVGETHTVYYPDSTVRETWTVTESIIRYTMYHTNGNAAVKGMYNHSFQRIGYWYGYYPSGSLEMTFRYKNGKRHGNWITFNEDGNVLSDVLFRRGDMIDGWAAMDGYLIHRTRKDIKKRQKEAKQNS